MALNFKSFCLYLLSAEIRGTSIPGGPRVTKAIENETMDKAHHSKSKKQLSFSFVELSLNCVAHHGSSCFNFNLLSLTDKVSSLWSRGQ